MSEPKPGIVVLTDKPEVKTAPRPVLVCLLPLSIETTICHPLLSCGIEIYIHQQLVDLPVVSIPAAWRLAVGDSPHSAGEYFTVSCIEAAEEH